MDRLSVETWDFKVYPGVDFSGQRRALEYPSEVNGCSKRHRRYQQMPRMNSVINSIVAVVVALLLMAVLFPVAIDEVFGADTSSWDSATTTVFELLPILGVIGGFLILIRQATTA